MRGKALFSNAQQTKGPRRAAIEVRGPDAGVDKRREAWHGIAARSGAKLSKAQPSIAMQSKPKAQG